MVFRNDRWRMLSEWASYRSPRLTSDPYRKAGRDSQWAEILISANFGRDLLNVVAAIFALENRCFVMRAWCLETLGREIVFFEVGFDNGPQALALPRSTGWSR